MPDYRNPQMGGQTKDFDQMMDEICTILTEGSLWHERAAMYMNEYGLRGFGRMHCHNSKHDHKKKLCLEKILVDRIDHIPMLHADGIVKAMSYSMNGGAQLKEHLKMYVNREKEFERCLIDAVRASVTVDMDIYKELCCILSGVQEEIFRVKQVSERLDLGGWNGHDIARVSKDLHKHHEDHDDMDYTLS